LSGRDVEGSGGSQKVKGGRVPFYFQERKSQGEKKRETHLSGGGRRQMIKGHQEGEGSYIQTEKKRNFGGKNETFGLGGRS